MYVWTNPKIHEGGQVNKTQVKQFMVLEKGGKRTRIAIHDKRGDNNIKQEVTQLSPTS